MGKISTVTTVATKPVQSATIVTKVAATSLVTNSTKVNIQAVGPSADSSGKPIFQYEAIIGTGPAAFARTYLAEQACIQEAYAAGRTNYTSGTTDGTTYCLLAW